MNAKAIFLLFLALLFPGFSSIWAQMPADSLYNQLESATLVVRLPSQHNKMEALRNSISDPDLSETSRKRLEARLKTVQEDTDVQNRAIVRSFQSYFNALPVFFIYDTTHNPARTVYLNEELQTLAQAEIDGNIIQLRFGYPLAYSGSRAESMILTDSRLQDLGVPFPKPVMMTGIGYGFNKLLAPEMAFERLLEKRVKKLDRKLQELL